MGGFGAQCYGFNRSPSPSKLPFRLTDGGSWALPGAGPAGRPMPNSARMSIACPCAPSVRRSGLRSCRGFRVLDDEATTGVVSVLVGIFGQFVRPVLGEAVSAMGSCSPCYTCSPGHPPPGPPAGYKWPFWALGGHRLLWQCESRAPRAPVPQANGRSWPARPLGRPPALASPPGRKPRTQARHPCTPPRATCPHTRQPARVARAGRPRRC